MVAHIRSSSPFSQTSTLFLEVVAQLRLLLKVEALEVTADLEGIAHLLQTFIWLHANDLFRDKVVRLEDR